MKSSLFLASLPNKAERERVGEGGGGVYATPYPKFWTKLQTILNQN